jgi:hypothetical protein
VAQVAAVGQVQGHDAVMGLQQRRVHLGGGGAGAGGRVAQGGGGE